MTKATMKLQINLDPKHRIHHNHILSSNIYHPCHIAYSCSGKYIRFSTHIPDQVVKADAKTDNKINTEEHLLVHDTRA